MVYKSKAKAQAELVEMSEVLFVASLTDTNENEDAEFMDEDEDEWDDLDPDHDDLLQIVALRALEAAQSMSGDGSRGSYDGILCSKDYFATLLQQPDQRFRYVFRLVDIILFCS